MNEDCMEYVFIVVCVLLVVFDFGIQLFPQSLLALLKGYKTSADSSSERKTSRYPAYLTPLAADVAFSCTSISSIQCYNAIDLEQRSIKQLELFLIL